MNANISSENEPNVTLRPVGRDNWRAVTKLAVAADQRDFVAEPCYYLALCAYDHIWQPLAITLDEQVIGFLMWAVDPADGNWCWLGGILVDQHYQGRGYGRQAVQAAIGLLATVHGHQSFALSYQPANTVAKHLYAIIGFIEMDEWEGDEVVARLSLTAQPARFKRGARPT
jgi:diamine N-acetyltransferase